jgi:ATP-binding cassette subfamily F protein 3
MAERIIELHPDGIQHFLGNYDDYTEKKQEILDMNNEPSEPFARHTLKQEGKAEALPEKQGAVSFEAEKQAKREERNRQRRLASLEEQIHVLESDITQLETEMTLPEIYQDYMALQERQQSLEEKKSQLEQIFAEWESLLEA